ncbi:hypothetical protein J6590_012332 [Homalodisca vitripennis]|nr:hypothetical protein J6590_012332 [Homalodisca vitripennis]
MYERKKRKSLIYPVIFFSFNSIVEEWRITLLLTAQQFWLYLFCRPVAHSSFCYIPELPRCQGQTHHVVHAPIQPYPMPATFALRKLINAGNSIHLQTISYFQPGFLLRVMDTSVINIEYRASHYINQVILNKYAWRYKWDGERLPPLPLVKGNSYVTVTVTIMSLLAVLSTLMFLAGSIHSLRLRRVDSEHEFLVTRGFTKTAQVSRRGVTEDRLTTGIPGHSTVGVDAPVERCYDTLARFQGDREVSVVDLFLVEKRPLTSRWPTGSGSIDTAVVTDSSATTRGLRVVTGYVNKQTQCGQSDADVLHERTVIVLMTSGYKTLHNLSFLCVIT